MFYNNIYTIAKVILVVMTILSGFGIWKLVELIF